MRYIFLFAMALVFGAEAAVARCNGRDLLSGQSAQMLADLETVSARHPYHEGRYYRVSKGNKVSHFIGTLHYADPQTKRIPAFFKQQLRQADALLVEIELEEAARLLLHLMSNPERIINSDGPKLETLFSEENYKQIESILRAKGIPRKFIPKLEPWFVANMLQEIPCTNEGNGILDTEIIKFAERLNVPVRGLETKDDLIPLLSKPDDKNAVKNIELALANRTFGPDIATTIKTLYLKGEVAKIIEFGYAFARRSLPNDEVARNARAFEDEILVGRNKSWLRVLLPELEKGNRVVAVGAGHFYGTGGLMRLLERRGYKIERLELK